MGAKEELMGVARTLFVARGFAGTSVGDIARTANVTTGALYHHFGSKEVLYREVVGQIAAEVGARAVAAMAGQTSPQARLVAAVEAVLDACLEPDVALAYTEAATVLGLEAWRALEAERTNAILAEALSALVDPKLVALVAPVIKGAVVEGAMTIVTAADRTHARTVVGNVLRGMVASLVPP